jgi:ribosome-associated protein
LNGFFLRGAEPPVPRKAVRATNVRNLALNKETEAARPPTRSRPVRAAQDAAREFAIAAARLMHADHCEDILLLDLRGISPVCDYFVIGTGTSDRQMRAIADHVKEHGKTVNEVPYGQDGYEDGRWIILDYVDVVIHLFDAENRSYYSLETLWGDSPKVKWAK